MARFAREMIRVDDEWCGPNSIRRLGVLVVGFVLPHLVYHAYYCGLHRCLGSLRFCNRATY